MPKPRKTSEEAMAEMENKEREAALNELGLDDEDTPNMPTDDEINAMFDQPDPGDEDVGAPDAVFPPNVIPVGSITTNAITPDMITSEPINETIGLQAECQFCHNPIFITAEPGTSQEEAEKIAGKFCKCAGAKLARQGSALGRKIDVLFGPESALKYGFADYHSPEEIEIIKTVGCLVAEGKVKGVVVTLENGDKATILVKKDNTVVRRNKATKAEMEA